MRFDCFATDLIVCDSLFCLYRGIQWNKLRNLVEIRRDKKEAVFDVMEGGKPTGKTEVLKVSVCLFVCLSVICRAKFIYGHHL